MKQFTFNKNTKYQNILFDEYFAEYCSVTIIAFNYDDQGNALCLCDGKNRELDTSTIKKIIFGVPKGTIENYLKSIFDPDSQTDFINRQNGHLLFRLLELKKLKKYDILNLAKQTLKEFSTYKGDTFYYFTEANNITSQVVAPACAQTLYGNTKSKVFHKTDCKSFNSITCTSLFTTHSEAVNAGFKPCRICKP